VGVTTPVEPGSGSAGYRAGVLVLGFPSGALQANCYLVATGEDAPCAIVDPGDDAADQVDALCVEHGLTPAAVLLTHGHFDHVGSAAELCERHGIEVVIGQSDRPMLADPAAAVSRQFAAMLAGQTFPPEPSIVRPISGSGALDLPGVPIDAIHTPGHTPGSTCYAVAGEGDRPGVLFTGDTLFAGTVGRSDLPGGDGALLIRSIRDRLLTWPDGTVVLPGHGPASTIGDERRANPFLVG
jgi:glyoxylase-like metal-dependent hydrolase (beta-lactamase superfamily II)